MRLPNLLCSILCTGMILAADSVQSHHHHVYVQENVYVTPMVPPPAQIAYAAPAPIEANLIIAPNEPPIAPVEQITINPYPDGAWVPGYWSWNGQWMWVKGYWGHRPYPGAEWHSGQWSYHPHHGGWVWRGGHWH